MTEPRSPELSNREVFWNAMERLVGRDPLRDWHPRIAEFYCRDFPGLGLAYRPDPVARRVVQAALDAGAEVILATYREILERRGLEAGSCIMVGNDVQEDVVPARKLGMTTFLVTGLTIDRSGEGHLADGRGDLACLASAIEGAKGRDGDGAGLRWPG